MSVAPLLIGTITTGATLILLYALDSRGSITVNNKIVGGVLLAGVAFGLYKVYGLLQTFV